LNTCNGQKEARSYYARKKMKISIPKIFFALLHTTAVVGAANNYDEKAARRTSLRQVNDEAPAVKHFNIGSQVHQARTNGGVTHLNLSSPQQGTKTTNNQNYDTHIVGGDEASVGEYPYFGKFGSSRGSQWCLCVAIRTHVNMNPNHYS
jgi:hypothetical protein